ncbi:conserved protein of unknown function [Paraburkholderia dioscoreae]|uniref:Uncharacterized protein n=1 Tax=Paraburkholderia dioscoreae TaxID=2604047 RepID=A0A5Q4ZF70_9BURK|nr:conserved protein of unknown function [Paraburkholderia dioscoreae]
MNMGVHPAIGTAALNGGSVHRPAIEALNHLTLRASHIERVGQPEAMNRHKGDCGR